MLLLTGDDNDSGYGFAFIAHDDSAKITICGFKECLIHHELYTVLLLTKWLTS